MQHTAALPARASATAWYVLLVLTGVTFFSYVDRHVLLLLAEPVKAHFTLSDLQLGLLQGSGLALFTALASFPLGWLADRYDRRWVLAGCIALWSVAVAACGMAESFPQLFLASGLVAIGEAGVAPVVYALIPMLFVGAQRQLANSIFAVTAVGGGALALALAGLLIEYAPDFIAAAPATLGAMEPWRVSFLLAALPAPLMILLVLSLRIPARALTAPVAADGAAAPGLAAYAMRHWQALLLLYLGVALAGMSFGAIGPWVAIGSARLYGESPGAVGASMGLGQIVSAASGFVLSLAAYRLFARRYGSSLPLRGILVANTAMMLSCLGLLASGSSLHLYVFYAVYGAFLSLGIMLHPTLMQSMMPTRFMGRAVALQFVFTMILAALPAPLVGALSDRLQHLPNGIFIAMASVAVPALMLSSVLLWRLLRVHLDRTVADAAATDLRS
jgi:MFS family permease